jgi:hypothetical protein
MKTSGIESEQKWNFSFNVRNINIFTYIYIQWDNIEDLNICCAGVRIIFYFM